LCGVERVGGRIERLFEIFERFRMIFQVHLHTAEIDISDPVGLQLAHRGDRGGL
jgi:hypothetical protein